MSETGFSFKDVLQIARRRFWWLVLPIALIIAIGVPVVFLIPATYKSTAVVLIENQDIPRDLVRSTVNTFANERLEVITARVTTTQRLVELIRRRNLYRDQWSKESMTSLAKRMRQNFTLKMIEANVVDGRTGSARKATIAFNLSFEHQNPAVAQQVVNDFVSLYISENLRTRRQKAQETEKFLANEVEKAKKAIVDLEQNLANFKKINAGALPEQMQSVFAQLGQAQGAIIGVIQRLELRIAQRTALIQEISQLPPVVSVGDVGKRGPSENAIELRKARVSLRDARSKFGPKHPVVVRAARRVGVLVAAIKREKARTEKLKKAEASLAAAKRKHASAVRRFGAKSRVARDRQRDVVRLEKALAKITKDTGGAEETRTVRNPAYVKAKLALATANAEIASLVKQKTALERRIRQLKGQVARAPQVERGYLLLQRNLKAAVANYQSLIVKLREARLGQSLEVERKSERFSLIEPANRPGEPESPNRGSFLMVVMLLAFGAGGGLVFALESSDRTIRNPRQLFGVTGRPPLVVLPVMLDDATARRQRRKRLLLLGLTFIVAVAIGVGAFLAWRLGYLDIVKNLISKA